MRRAPSPVGRSLLAGIFAAPLGIALVSAVGLVSALTGDGLRDAVSWIALAVPLLVIGRALGRRG